MKQTRITDTPGLIALSRAGHGLNRGLTPEGEQALDPAGKHVLKLSFIHNDDHLRTWWLAKIRAQDTPHEVFIDTTFEAFERFTRQYEAA